MSAYRYLSIGGINLVFRGSALAAKFLFVVYLARYFTLEELGLYGLMASLIVFSLQFLGMDYYVYNGRRILGAPDKNKRACLIKEQLRFHFVVYLLFIPIYVAIFALGILDVQWSWAALAITIIFAEHLSQESSRLLTTLSRSPEANIIFFLRTGLWMAIFMVLAYHNSSFNNFSAMALFWVAGVCIASLVAAWRVWRLFDWHTTVCCNEIGYLGLLQGIKQSFPFFVSTLALQVIEVSDRFLLEFFLGTAPVGVYVFNQNMASLLQTLAVVGLISVIAPKLIGAYMRKDRKGYREAYRMLILLVISLLVVSVPAIFFAYPLVADYSGKVEIMANQNLFSVVLAGYILSILSMIPYYSMYVRHKDWALAATVLTGALMNIILNIILIPTYGLYGAAYSTVIAFMLILVLRTAISYKIQRCC